MNLIYFATGSIIFIVFCYFYIKYKYKKYDEIETLKEETVRLKNENALLTELLLENDYRILQQMEMLNNSQKAE
jgi:Ca2+/Na+ antiporter